MKQTQRDKTGVSGMTPPPQLLPLSVWYVVFGALHELIHIAVAGVLLSTASQTGHLQLPPVLQQTPLFWFQALLLRQCRLDGLTDEQATVVRHAGWIGSVLLAVAIATWYGSISNRRSEKISKSDTHLRVHFWVADGSHLKTMLLCAIVTAMEALATDLVSPLSFSSSSWNTDSLHDNRTSTHYFFCGNFGVLLLHEAWQRTEKGRHALDVLETMIRVTTMRGAQTGGTVCYDTQSGKAIRSRVVNRKRTDLAQRVRSKVSRDVSFERVSFVAGHTRFATSSKATLDGTHPHLWTPPTEHRLFDFLLQKEGQKQNKNKMASFKSVRVENYVTHNGDFEFYTDRNERTHSLRVIQGFLEVVLDSPMPVTVDSCAIAGMVDLLRCQGSFALSARCVVALQLSTSTLELSNDKPHSFPAWADFDRLGRACEEVWAEYIVTVSSWESVERGVLAITLANRFEKGADDLLYPLAAYLTDDEGGASTAVFCRLLVDTFLDHDLFFAVQTFLKHAKGSFGLCVTSSIDAHRQMVLAARGQTVSHLGL